MSSTTGTVVRTGVSPDGTVAEYHHLEAVETTCPSGHTIKTQKASGQKLRCGRCFQEHGRVVMVTVPRRPDGPQSLPPKPAKARRRMGTALPDSGPTVLPAGWALAGWRAVADQWLQPGGLAQTDFSVCYRLFYGRSQQFDTSVI